MRARTITAAILLTAMPLIATPRLTVDQLIETALRYSPDINISANQLDASFARKDQADAGYLPQIDALGSVGKQGIKLKDEDLVDDTLFSGTLSATQLIYDFGKTGGSMDAAGFDVDADDAKLQQTISDKIFEIKDAYYTALQSKALIRVDEENVKLNEAQLHRAQRYYEAGIRTKVDVTDAEVNLIQARLGLNNSLYDHRHARVELEKRIGLAPNHGDYTLYREDVEFEKAYDGLPPFEESVDELEKFTYLNRYEIREFKSNIKSKHATIGSIYADYYPGIYANGSYAYQEVDKFRNSTPEQTWQATIDLRWNLFAGFRTDAQVQEARVNMLSAASEYETVRLLAKKNTDDAYLFVLKGRDDVKLNQSLTRAAKEKHEQVEQRYQHGLADYVELQQARQSYIDSLSGIVTAYYEYYISLARLDNAVGR